MMRKRLDLPQPDRPSNATISPVRSVSETSFSTGGPASPEPLAKVWLTWLTSRSVAACGSSMTTPGSEAQTPFGVGVELAPEQAVEKGDENRHHGDAEHDLGKIALVGGFRDIGSDAMRGDR